MPKVDKSNYTKEQWKQVRDSRRQSKRERLIEEHTVSINELLKQANQGKMCFVLGNGTSRKSIDLPKLAMCGKIYACNAVYRTFAPDYLVAVDVKMVLEINRAGYQHKHPVWTNPNKSFEGIRNLNYFNPGKGWSSGPTALWLAAQHGYQKIFILGFDYSGLNDGKSLNNLYADTMNYKKSSDSATFFGNWLRQTASVIKENPHIEFYRVIQPDNYLPQELNKFDNLNTILVKDFMKMFNL